MAAHTGLEPVISALRGQRVNRLHQCAAAGEIIGAARGCGKLANAFSVAYTRGCLFPGLCQPWADISERRRRSSTARYVREQHTNANAEGVRQFQPKVAETRVRTQTQGLKLAKPLAYFNGEVRS